MVKLYQREDCPFSQKVRSKLTELGLTYVAVNVAPEGRPRPELVAESGQSKIPCLLLDGEVLLGADGIIARLEERFGPKSAPDEELVRERPKKTLEDRPHYGMTRQLAGLSVYAAREKVQQVLTKEGFHVVCAIDVAATLRTKLRAELGREYLVLGVLSPRLTQQGLGVEPYLGLLLLCNVVVTASDGGDAIVSVARPVTTLEMVDNPGVRQVADREEAMLLRVITSL